MVNKYEPPRMEVLNPETLDCIKLALDNLRATCAELGESLRRIAKTLVETIGSLGGDIARAKLYSDAYTWALCSHPEWAKILNRTKKSRIREKYQKRIVREFLKK